MLAKSCNTQSLINSHHNSTLFALKYHQQALFHNEVLFWVCLVIGSLLLGVAIALVLHALLVPGVSFGLAAVDVAAGLLLKLVSALFYKEMNASRERTIVLYDRMQRDNRLDRSAALVSGIPDKRIKSTTIAKLALQMASDSEPPVRKQAKPAGRRR